MRVVCGSLALVVLALLPAARAAADEVLVTSPPDRLISGVAAIDGHLLWSVQRPHGAADVFDRYNGRTTRIGRGASVGAARGRRGRPLAVLRSCAGERCAMTQLDLRTGERRTVHQARVLGATVADRRFAYSVLRRRASTLSTRPVAGAGRPKPLLGGGHSVVSGELGALSAGSGVFAWLRERGDESRIEGAGRRRPCLVALAQGQERMTAPVLVGRTLYFVVTAVRQDGGDPTQEHPRVTTWTAERATLGADGCTTGAVDSAFLGRRTDHSIPQFGTDPTTIEGYPVSDGGRGAFTGDIAFAGGRLLEVTQARDGSTSVVARALQFG